MHLKNPLFLACLLALPIKGGAAPTEVKLNAPLGDGAKPVVVQTGQQNAQGPAGAVIPTLGGGVLGGVDLPTLLPAAGSSAQAAPARNAAAPGAAAPSAVPGSRSAVPNAKNAAPAARDAKAGAVEAPAVGEREFQRGLQRVGEGARDIGKAVDEHDARAGGLIQASVVGGALFDGAGRRAAGNFADQPVGSDGKRGPPRGFGGAQGNGSGRRFQAALVRLGVPRQSVRKLSGLMAGWHPGDQSGVYHGLPHSFAVADTLAQLLDGPEGARYTNSEKVELLLAAALHDVDPEREAGKPARVSATLAYLSENESARALVAEFEPYGASLERVQTLIKYTDFNMDPEAMAQIKRDAAEMAGRHFADDAARGAEKGELLAYVDKSAMYTGSYAFARDAVIGLSNEIGAPKEAILKGTPGFLKGLIWKGEPRASGYTERFERLPSDLRANFLEVYARFEREAALDGASASERAEAGKSELAASLEAAVDAFQDGLRWALGVARSVNPIAGRSTADARAPPAFAAALADAGVPRELTGRLTGLLLGWHPGDQGKIYHGLPHTFRVADTAAEILKGTLGRAATKEERVLMLLAAALHDVDPARAPGSPARVSATLEFLKNDPRARSLVEDFAPYGVDADRLATLIKYTDFNMDPEAMARIQRDAAAMAEAHFPDPARGRVLGRALAYADKTAMYVDTVEFAEASVRGLAAEIGAPENAILAGTAGFLRPLIYADASETGFAPEFSLLPKDLQRNFLRTYAHFKGLAPKPAAKAPADPPGGMPGAAEQLSLLGRAQRLFQQPGTAASFGDNPDAFAGLAENLYGPNRPKPRSPGTSEAIRLQRAYAAKLQPAIKALLERYKMTEKDVTSHGTTLRAALGMLLEGELLPTEGFGDGAQRWAASGTGGASYTARAVGAGEPGAVILMDNTGNRQNHRIDYVDRAKAGEDFLAIVVTDGESVAVLDREAVRALAASAAKMKDKAADYNRPGWKMSDLDRWEALRSRLNPSR